MRRGRILPSIRAALLTLAILGGSALAVERLLVPRVAAGMNPVDLRRFSILAALVLASVLAFLLTWIERTSQRRSEAAQQRDYQEQLLLLPRQAAATETLGAIGSWEWEAGSQRVSWSDGMFQLFGVERGNFQPTVDGILRRIPSEDREAVRLALRQAEGGQPFLLEHRLLRPDGEVRIVLERAAVVDGPAGQPPRIVGTTQDVTDRRGLEDRLQMRKEIYLSLLASQSDLGEGALLTEGDQILYANTALQQLFGKEPPFPDSLAAFLADIDPAAESGLRRELEARRERALPSAQGEDRLGQAGANPIDVEFVIDSISQADRVRTVALVRDVTQRKRAEAELRRSREKLRLFSLELSRVREEESTRIARAIHDDLGQRLTGLKMDLAWVAARLGRDEAQRDLPSVTAKLAEMSALADESIQEVRRIATELRPGVLDDLGFAAALDWQCEEFSRRTGIPCQVFSPADVEITDEVSTALFRITQEALTNIIRHARASRVEVRLIDEEDAVVLEIEDDGQGLSAPTETVSLGLLGMAERARQVGGVAFIGPAPERGTIVLIRVPKEPADAKEATP